MKFPPMTGVFDHLIVHCAATPPSMDVGAAWIDRVHRRKGWSMCGYHIVITRSGEIQWDGNGHRTRPIAKVGSHVGGCGAGWNKRSLGVCLIGGVKEDGTTPEDNFTPEQFATLREVIDASLDAFDIPAENVMGHRDLIKLTQSAPKACPCFSVREFMERTTPDDDWFETAYDAVRDAFNGEKRSDPTLGVPKQYSVKAGDTLFSISRTYGVQLGTLRSLNKIDSSATIRVGQRLQLTE